MALNFIESRKNWTIMQNNQFETFRKTRNFKGTGSISRFENMVIVTEQI